MKYNIHTEELKYNSQEEDFKSYKPNDTVSFEMFEPNIQSKLIANNLHEAIEDFLKSDNEIFYVEIYKSRI